ncbi:hypothetical protein PIG65_05010 [Enterobacter sp. FR 78]|uniref:hypothetical protein n=1 Tax=Enterobacter sp. FR 78 TaxID=3021714 RepID=UPI0023A9BD64|nr:hypothetical protein [Enterobacter sp. FR 78]MDD9577881.1 hypothetical protein [Enterobacter sp. FR 78]
MSFDLSKYDCKGIVLVAVFSFCSIGFSALFGSAMVNNTDALNLVANVFAVLSGFLLLVITMTSDTASILDGLSDTEKENQKTRFKARFSRYYILFILYFLVLVMIFIYYLMQKSSNTLLKDYPLIKASLEYAMAFFIPFSFLNSLFIPLKIKELFLEKFDLHS